MVCAFIGHRYTPAGMKEKIREAVIDLIENHGVNMFYMGHHGYFDGEAREVVRELSEIYDIDYAVVLSRLPYQDDPFVRKFTGHTVIPDDLGKKMPRFRIIYTNQWMISKADYVITYIDNPYGTGAARFASEAEKKGKIMIKLGEL